MNTANSFLDKDSNNTMALVLKGKILDLPGKYDEAIYYYDKVAGLSHNRFVVIYSVLAKRKKADYNKTKNR